MGYSTHTQGSDITVQRFIKKIKALVKFNMHQGELGNFIQETATGIQEAWHTLKVLFIFSHGIKIACT